MSKEIAISTLKNPTSDNDQKIQAREILRQNGFSLDLIYRIEDSVTKVA